MNRKRTVAFSDPESGLRLIGEVLAEGAADGLPWLVVVTPASTRWLVPIGSPNSPAISERRNPKAFAHILSLME